MTTLGCPRCLTPASPEAVVCTHCGASLGHMPAPFFAGAATWRRDDNELRFEATSSMLTPRLVDAIPPDFDAAEVFDDQPPAPPSPPEPLPESRMSTEDVAPLPAAQYHLAPVWKRVVALLIDALPVLGAVMLTLLALERKLEAGQAPIVPSNFHELSKMFWTLGPWVWLVVAVLIVVPVAYQALALAYMGGGVGDLLMGIRWVTQQGERPRITRTLLRSAVAIPSWLLALSGVLLMLLTRTRRTLYDVVSGLYPVQK